MTLTNIAKRKFTAVVSVTLICMLFGILYPLIFQPVVQRGPLWHSNFNGAFIGLFLGLAVMLGEMFLFQSLSRRLRFSVFIALQTLYYLVVIHVCVISVMVTHLVIAHGYTFAGALQSPDFQPYFFGGEYVKINLYAFVMIFLVNFVRRVNRMLGQNALANFITGKYHNPVEEERVFMFLDLKASTGIAEKLGHKRYHRFLNDFFFDITPAIVESKGEIYQYVGDEVVVTWTKDRGLRDANCINCFFRIAAAIAKVSDKYERRYGFIPTFKAGYHIGAVITGLIGDIKRDIVFHGDTVNTASRIRSECTVVKRDLLLSHSLLERLSISSYLTPESIGKIKLRGKEEEIELYAIKEAA
ncbi:MAG: putative adenylate/guanylate cyclase [Bacteroidetes bacterium]|nr:putative adenylate/guanylate cyclase [Bacteroidota bacterium]